MSNLKGILLDGLPLGARGKHFALLFSGGPEAPDLSKQGMLEVPVVAGQVRYYLCESRAFGLRKP